MMSLEDDEDGDTSCPYCGRGAEDGCPHHLLTVNLHDVPEKITIDKSGANTAAIESVKAEACVDILMRQCKYLNNIVEQDHWAIKRITRAIFGFKSFWSARIIIAGIETMHMIRKEQMDCPEGKTMSAANQFYSLAV